MKKKVRRDKKSKKNTLKKIIIISIISIAFLASLTYIALKEFNSSEPVIPTSKPIIGEVYSLNATANFLDYLYTNENIVMSPINANSALAILYNGTDNNSYKELKKYFHKTPELVNNRLSPIIKSLNEEQELKLNSNYAKQMSVIYNNGYNNLKTKDIDKLTQSEKEVLIITLIKADNYFNQKKIKLSNKYIEKYKLSDKEKMYSSYVIKELLDKVLIEYEKHTLLNSVNNYQEIFYDKKLKIENEYLKNIKELYNTNLTPVDLSNPETKNLINNKLLEKNSNYTRILTREELQDLVMINTLSFDYKWQNAFSSENVKDEEFNGFNDQHYMVDMMYSQENIYLENEKAIGFIKNFDKEKYSFVGILPKEKGSYQNSELNLETLLSSRKKMLVNIGLPKFKIESTIDLSKLYSNYKINEIFTDKANLHGITNTNLKVATMLQKEYLSIGEYGTTESTTKSETLKTNTTDDNTKSVILNRPFTFLIINNSNNEVLLAGKVINIE